MSAQFLKAILIAIPILLIGARSTKAEAVNKCEWIYSDIESKVRIIHEIAERKFAKKSRSAIKTSRGDVVSFDFIPGSLNKEPLIIDGGLWYKIEYFDFFNRITTQQSLLKEVFDNDGELTSGSLHQFIVEGHPIVVIARATQPESIYASLKNGITPSFVQRNQKITLEDHAQDTIDVINHLKETKQVGKKKKIQLLSLSYGVTVAMQTAAKLGDQISHKHIIAPLSKSGDNFPKETAMQDKIVNATKDMYALWKLNPLTAWWAEAASNKSVDFIYLNASSKYSAKLIEDAFKSDQNLVALENEIPGIKEAMRKGLQNDMDAARPDRFRLDDEKMFQYFSKTTIYLAGTEEPARLKAQLAAYEKIKTHLGKNAPNLLIMGEAQHAITASAPIHTSHYVTTAMKTMELQKSNGTIFYMHKLDPTARVVELDRTFFELISAEINAESLASGIPSILEAILFPEIFKGRVQYNANAISDLLAALQGKKEQPVDFKPSPARPYEKLQYADLTEKDIAAINTELKSFKAMLESIIKIQDRAIEFIKQHKPESKP
jgi:hypothetical protein